MWIIHDSIEDVVTGGLLPPAAVGPSARSPPAARKKARLGGVASTAPPFRPAGRPLRRPGPSRGAEPGGRAGGPILVTYRRPAAVVRGSVRLWAALRARSLGRPPGGDPVAGRPAAIRSPACFAGPPTAWRGPVPGVGFGLCRERGARGPRCCSTARDERCGTREAIDLLAVCLVLNL